MARKRMIDPNIWQSEDFSKLSNLSKIIFIGLFSLADDEGYGKANPTLIKNSIFPFDEKLRTTDIEKSLQEAATSMSIVFYTAEDGKDYYCLTNWDKWQTIQKPTSSKIPKLSEKCTLLYDYSTATVGLQPNRKEENKNIIEKNKKEKDDPHFVKFWEEYPKKVGKADARKVFKKLNADDELLDKMLNAIKVAKNTAQWKDDKGKYIPHPATWLNGRRWEDELEVKPTGNDTGTVF